MTLPFSPSPLLFGGRSKAQLGRPERGHNGVTSWKYIFVSSISFGSGFNGCYSKIAIP